MLKKQIVIALTGTPGTGKTSVASELARRGWIHLELSKLVKKEKLYSGWDKKRKTWIVDEIKLKNIAVDSHISHILPTKFFSAVFVLRCAPAVLEKRLKSKKWSKEKIRENVEAEIIGLIEWEAKQKHKKVFVINLRKNSVQATANAILRKISA